MVEGPFDAAVQSRAILQRLATVAGLPSVEAMQLHLGRLRSEVASTALRLNKAARTG